MARINNYSAGASHYAYSLTLARTCYFATMKPAIDPRKKRKRNGKFGMFWIQPCLTWPAYDTSWSFPLKSNNKLLFSDLLIIPTFSKQNISTKKGRKKCFTLSCFSCHEALKLTHADPDKSIWNFYLSSGQTIWSDARIQEGRVMHISRCIMTR